MRDARRPLLDEPDEWRHLPRKQCCISGSWPAVVCARCGSQRLAPAGRVDPETGERYTDVIVFWVESDFEKEAILADDSLPYFTTPHFDGHPSVLVRGSRIGELSRHELAVFVEGAWLSRAGPRAVARWMKERVASGKA